MTDEPIRLLTEKQAAEYLGISHEMMRRLRVTGRVAYIKLSTRLYRYRKEDLRTFVQESAVREAPPAELSTRQVRSIGRAARARIVPFSERQRNK